LTSTERPLSKGEPWFRAGSGHVAKRAPATAAQVAKAWARAAR
jgi:hypothetical protein